MATRRRKTSKRKSRKQKSGKQRRKNLRGGTGTGWSLPSLPSLPSFSLYPPAKPIVGREKNLGVKTNPEFDLNSVDFDETKSKMIYKLDMLLPPEIAKTSDGKRNLKELETILDGYLNYNLENKIKLYKMADEYNKLELKIELDKIIKELSIRGSINLQEKLVETISKLNETQVKKDLEDFVARNIQGMVEKEIIARKKVLVERELTKKVTEKNLPEYKDEK